MKFTPLLMLSVTLLVIACSSADLQEIENTAPSQDSNSADTSDTVNEQAEVKDLDSEVLVDSENVVPAEEVTDKEDDYEEYEDDGNEYLGKPIFTGPFSEIACDEQTRTLTMTFSNPTDLTWNIDKQLPFPTPQGMAIVSLSMNGVEINGRQPAEWGGETLYGPEYPFSKNCEGDVELEPGESITCTVRPIPLSNSELDGKTNELQILAPGVSHVETFFC